MSNQSPKPPARRRLKQPGRRGPLARRPGATRPLWARTNLPPVQDPGLQPERTVMSWHRTTLALSVVALLFLRWFDENGPVVFIPALIAFIGGAFIQLFQRRRYFIQVLAIARESIRADVVAVFWVTGLLVLMAIFGLIAVWI